MISERPWRVEGPSEAGWMYIDEHGSRVPLFSSYPRENLEDDAEHIVACVNAIHAAGIRPQDVAVFVEAVRKFINTPPARREDKPALAEWVIEHTDLWETMHAAAALLERKSE